MRAEVERIGSKAIAEMRNHHDFLVGLYYDLKALQAELDPYSRGGPSFEHAGPLLEQLKKPRSAA